MSPDNAHGLGFVTALLVAGQGLLHILAAIALWLADEPDALARLDKGIGWLIGGFAIAYATDRWVARLRQRDRR